mmetsp:Transcript_24592/g.56304  ORF Transcript_24592/g.56304 Transcript_24592/m.56304 type:complete len:164 (+) Transcript_24592:251-742(+)|eukprot:CAMPEP_0113298436 /NCGR_PEP_ID=MMETSP0010_2-20120614/882_1 /TAXON_ID=216773 ORGANISM="Corethron hystrix, Strain 308" /NCGR_SAMPLE_ID=MMETSP0010_2 /ASSEMBLY_ACC=CAM_ASM_000155 /LENGTH=163 /DNA_ID=CAMNT_0000151491 /DNA_START=72 /DNA_END=563 /DNA_ORIENTATION=+ /assembly_acc=CAM_ASM_000155
MSSPSSKDPSDSTSRILDITIIASLTTPIGGSGGFPSHSPSQNGAARTSTNGRLELGAHDVHTTTISDLKRIILLNSPLLVNGLATPFPSSPPSKGNEKILSNLRLWWLGYLFDDDDATVEQECRRFVPERAEEENSMQFFLTVPEELPVQARMRSGSFLSVA